MKIGVFDSGVGGLSVAQAIGNALPEHEILFRNDAQHVPYGTKPPEELLGYVQPILQSLVRDGSEVIIIACNTVSTTLIDTLRESITVPLIAVEPMVKEAAELTTTKVIAICATPTTLASDRYKQLKETYAQGIKVFEPDCSTWTRMIEDNKVDHATIEDEINDAIALDADVIVLGCTHYHWIEDEINEISGARAQVIQPTESIILQLQKLIKKS